MSYDAPQSRNEAILQNILGANNVLVDPQSRIEAILQAILYDEIYDEEAMSRMEELLLAIKNNGTWNHEPISRNEEILYAKLNGETYDKEPQSRIEALLIDWCNQSPITIVTDTAPYLFRQSGGDNNAYVGTEETDKLVGASAVVNQLVDIQTTMQLGLTASMDATGVISISGTSTTSYSNITKNLTAITGHKYLAIKDVVANPNNITFMWTMFNVTKTPYESASASTQEKIIHVTTGGLTTTGISGFTSSTDFTGVKVRLLCVDLTAMFGTAIADYAFSLESVTRGSGIAYLRKYGFFTKDYYPYTANALQSVNTSAHVISTGKNRFDKSGDYVEGYINDSGAFVANANIYLFSQKILVNPSTNYTISRTGTGTVRVVQYDINGRFLQRASLTATSFTITTNASAYYVLMNPDKALVNNDIQFELGTIATAYEPYSKHEYSLPNVDLRGLYKLDASNNLYADGDTLEGDGTLTRKYEQRPYQSGDESLADAITDGTNTVVKLVTPTTEQSTGFTNPQVVDKYGTEEYTDERDFPMPVGHETKYPSR